MKKLLTATGIFVLSICLADWSRAAIEVVYSNSPSPGDDFTNSSSSNIGAAISGTNLWVYNNVRNNGHVGINDNFAQSGNGSAWFQGTQGPGGLSSKADIEFINGGPTNITAMGTLGNLDSLAYDWYKSSSSAASQHSSLRLYVDADGNLGTTNDRGYLVYERAYQSDNSVPTNNWVSDDLFDLDGIGTEANLWQVAFGAGNFDTAGNWQPLSVWQSTTGFTPSGGGRTFNADSVIYGISSGIGSGWGTYEGAVDNITIGFNGDSTTYNFEVQSVVPEPATILVWSGIAACAGLAYLRKKQSA